MATIDKTYTDSYNDYKEFKNWADKQVLTFFNDYKVCIGDYVWNLTKEDFDDGEVAIMNTPTWLDVYFIQNCKSDFVLDRLKEVYGEKFYNEYKTVDLTSPPSDDFKQNRKIKIIKTNKTKFPLHSKPYKSKRVRKRNRYWWLQSNNAFWYHTDTKMWFHYEFLYPHNTNTASIKSIKRLIRHLRKQYLPIGVTFRLFGRYVGEDYLVVVS